VNKTEKAKLSSSIGDKLKNAQAAIVSDFTGINVPSIAKLRRDCRKANIDFMVVKNSLFKRAIKDTQFAEIDKFLDGPTSVALSTKDPVGLAKTLVEFAKTEQNLKLKGGMFDGKIININDIKKISALPSRDVLLAMVLSGMKSPHRKLVFVLNGVISKFVNVMSQIKEKKEKQTSTNPK
jgi:large subunit ribosomal protein L10